MIVFVNQFGKWFQQIFQDSYQNFHYGENGCHIHNPQRSPLWKDENYKLQYEVRLLNIFKILDTYLIMWSIDSTLYQKENDDEIY